MRCVRLVLAGAIFAILTGCATEPTNPADLEIYEAPLVARVGELPAPVRQALQQAYPQQSVVVTHVSQKPSGLYEVEFVERVPGQINRPPKQEVYVTPDGQIVARQTFVRFEDAPAPVRKAIERLREAGENISAVERTVNANSPTVYEVEFRGLGEKREFYISESGEVVAPGPMGGPPSGALRPAP